MLPVVPGRQRRGWSQMPGRDWVYGGSTECQVVMNCGELAGEGRGVGEDEAVTRPCTCASQSVLSSHEARLRFRLRPHPRRLVLPGYFHAALLVYYHMCSIYWEARPRCS